MKNKIKVIFCTDGIFPYQVGGMQRHSRLLIEYLAKTGKVDLTVLHPHQQKIFPSELKIDEILISDIDKTKNYLVECYKYSKRIYNIIQQEQYSDAIIYSQGLCVWHNISKLKIPVVVNPHGLEAYQCISVKEKIIAFPFKMIFNYIFKHSTKVVSLGGKLTEILNSAMQSSESKVVVLPNAVELPNVVIDKNYNHNKVKLLFVGRFAHNKGIDILLKVVKQLNNEGFADKLEFNLGGKGELFDYYSKNFKYDNVHYLGFISDNELIDLYKTNDVFILPTLYEGMPTVVLEAMSYGMPVIVTDVGATSELVDSTNGFLVNKNSIEELRKAIIKFFALSINEKKSLSINSYNRVSTYFTWDKVAEAHILQFEKLQRNSES